MYSANCIQNTLKKCIHNPDVQNQYMLTDRYQNAFPVIQNCMHCYNILYNTVPLSLHGQLEKLQKTGLDVLRLDFTLENEKQTRAVLEYYINKTEGIKSEDINSKDINADFLWKDYTNGHFKRGVE